MFRNAFRVETHIFQAIENQYQKARLPNSFLSMGRFVCMLAQMRLAAITHLRILAVSGGKDDTIMPCLPFLVLSSNVRELCK